MLVVLLLGLASVWTDVLWYSQLGYTEVYRTRLLTEAGSDKASMLQVTIFLADIGDFPAMNAVWDQWVVQGQTPPRATVEAKLARPEFKVEVKVIAAQK